MSHELTQMDTQEHSTSKTTTQPASKTRFLPVVGLFFLAPLVGEFLLGNLPITWWWALISLAPLYGGGAILIRELARRFRLGWPGMVVLGLTYAVIEEAFVTQSLFNPNYVGLRLLDYGFIPALGISAWWTVFVLGIHTIWSTAVPIALVESMTSAARRTPWLGPWGMAVALLLFLLGCAMSFFFGLGESPFFATTMQFVGSGVVVLLLVVIAFTLRRFQGTAQDTSQSSPATHSVGIATFLMGSVFMGLANIPNSIPAAIPVIAMLAVLAGGSWLLWRWSRRPGWSPAHELAAASGLLLVYAWYGFIQVPSVGDTSPLVDAIGNGVFAVGALILLYFAWRRIGAHQESAAEA